MKKKLLFTIDSLGCGGAEKSLVTLLSLLDYTKYDVELLLFSRNGLFEKYLPKDVQILDLPPYIKFTQQNFKQQLFSRNIKFFISRIYYSLLLRCNKSATHTKKAVLFWKATSACFNTITKSYDIAIAYAQGVPSFFIAEKITAEKKIAWVNATIFFETYTKQFNQNIYSKFNNIVFVSDNAKNLFNVTFPLLANKFRIIPDLLVPILISKLSESKFATEILYDKPILLTVARLDNGDKGYDITLEACKILHDRGVEFRWYAIGEGGFRSEMEQFIKENGLEDIFILLGTKANPYPYFKACDLYVQTSRHEGFGLSIAEARILNKPVVTTEYDAVWEQMVQGKNGVVVPIDATAVADAIHDLIEHPEKRERISAYQRTEKKGNLEELQKFYDLIDD